MKKLSKVTVGILVCLLCILIGSVWGQTFFISEGPAFFLAQNGDSNCPPCPNDATVVYNALVKYSESLWQTVLDPNFTVDSFMDTTHPYGDVNYDGVCNFLDKEIWDNVWTSTQKVTHRQKCWQMEKKAKSWLEGTFRQAKTHLELMHGVRFTSRKKPIIIIH